MSLVGLLEVAPRRPADGVAVVSRFVWNARSRADYFDVQWRPGLRSLPKLVSSIGFDGARFGSGAIPQAGEIAIHLDPSRAGLAGMIWKGAELTLRTAPWPRGAGFADPADGDFATTWTGKADAARTTAGDLIITAIDAGQELLRPALAARFGSSGDALLDSADVVDRAGTVVPRGWGAIEGVPGILVDRAYGIYLFLGNPADSQAGFFDGGAAIDAGVARASLAALRANAPAAGTIDYCLDAGGLVLARSWTAPEYPLTGAFACGSTLAADIAAAIVGERTALSFTAGAVAAFNAAMPADCGLYIADDRSVADALDTIFAGLGSWWKVTSAGEIDLRQLAPAAPVRSFTAAEIESVERIAVVMPTRRRQLGYRRNNRVHSEGEIASSILSDALDKLAAVEPGATRNAPGQGLRDVAFEDWHTHYGMARLTGAVAGLPASWVVRIPCAGGPGGETAELYPLAAAAPFRLPVQPGRTVYAGAYVAPDAGDAPNRDLFLRLYWFDADGIATGTQASLQVAPGATAAYRLLSATPPADAAFAAYEIDVNGGGAGAWYVATPFQDFTAPGADVTDYADARVANGAIVANADGTVSYFNGTSWVNLGAVTIAGLGYSGDLAATKNLLFVQPGDPGAVANGAFWADTSASPNVLRQRIGGAWVTVSNLVTTGSHIGVDDAATSSDNKIVNSNYAAGASAWALPASSSVVAGGATDPSVGLLKFDPSGSYRAAYANGAALIAVPMGADRLYFSGYAASTVVRAPGSFGIFIDFYSADGSFISGGVAPFDLSTAFSYAIRAGTADVPAGASYFRTGWDCPTFATGLIYATKLRIAGIQVGADVTSAQPIVSRLDPNTGRALNRRILSTFYSSGAQQIYSVNPLSAVTDSGGAATISIAAHTISDDVGVISFSAGSIGGLGADPTNPTTYYVYEDNQDYSGGARSYVATTSLSDLAAADRRFVGKVDAPPIPASGTSAPSTGNSGGRPGPGEDYP